MSKYYPGFLAAFFIVLLRMAIGWHFLHEGFEKVKSTEGGKEPFSAEIYLRNANGPFGSYFRHMIPDVDSLEQLDPNRLKDEWTADVSRISRHFGFDSEQQKQAQTILDQNLQEATYWFNEPANAEKLKKYEHDVRRVEQTDGNPESLSYQKERANDARRGLEADRRSLIAPLVERQKALRDAIAKKVATPDTTELGGSGQRASHQLVHDQRSDDVRTGCDRVLPDGRAIHATRSAVGGDVPGDDLPCRCRRFQDCRRIPRRRVITSSSARTWSRCWPAW